MRQTILAAAAAFVIGGVATGAVLSQAQPTPPGGPPADVTEAMPARMPGMPGGSLDGRSAGMAGPMSRPPHHVMAWGHPPPPHWGGPRKFALIYRQPDRQLAAADVQKIAEAFLLWNGNHTWKVTDVAATPDGPIAFSFTTPEGSVLAKFTIDPHTAHITRVG